MKKTIILAFLASLISSTLAFPAIASANGNLALIVKKPDPYSDNQSWFLYQKKAGGVIHDTVVIRNNSDQKMKAHIYAVDATSNETGSFILKLENDPQKSIGLWTKLKSNDLTVEPKQSVDVPFSINIPDNLIPGEYFGGLALEESADETGDAASGQSRNCCTNVTVKTRVGSRIYLTIPGALNENIGWSDFSYEKKLGQSPVFRLKIGNSGNVSYEPKVSIDVEQNGALIEHIEKILDDSLPGTTIQPVINFSKVPFFGNFKAKATVTFYRKNQEIVYGLHGAPTRNLTKTISFWIVPWEIFLILAIILISAVSIWGSHKNRKPQSQQNPQNSQTPQDPQKQL